jgi:type IV pilus assembly protein PilC
MFIYKYEAKTSGGQIINGKKEAPDKVTLEKILKEDDLTLIEAFVEKRNVIQMIPDLIQKFLPVNITEKMLFARYLHIIIKAGFSINKALSILILQTKNKKMRDALETIRDGITRGNAFSEELKKFPNIFNELFVNMVAVGEKSGSLQESLKIIAKSLQKDHQLKSRIKGAMVYPIVIVTALLGIGILMLVFVIPQLEAVFSEMGFELPITTKILLGGSKLLLDYWMFFLVGVMILIYAFWKMTRSKLGHKFLSRLSLRTPIIKPLVQKINTARIVRTLGSLLLGGVSLTEALKISAGTISNVEYADSLLETAKAVEKGLPIHQIFEKYPLLYPPLVSQMIVVGEETGTLADILLQLAVFYEGEVSSATKNMSSIVEPVVMIVVGLAVGFFALAIIQPMYSMANNL